MQSIRQANRLSPIIAAMTYDLAVIGFGEAGSAFAASGEWQSRAKGWDTDVIARSRAVDAGSKAGLEIADSAAEALVDASLVMSLVTADQALAAALSYAPLLAPGALWCDGNSVAPATKQAAAKAIATAGGRYVDMAILAPVNPARLAVPMVLSGPEAAAAVEALRDLGFSNLRVVGAEVGQASAIKMVRSVMVKGVEALTDEMMAAAEAAGVSAEVLASLDASTDVRPWREKAAYNLERMATHGARRAAEMEQSALTLRALGVVPLMTEGTIQRQRSAAKVGQTE